MAIKGCYIKALRRPLTDHKARGMDGNARQGVRHLRSKWSAYRWVMSGTANNGRLGGRLVHEAGGWTEEGGWGMGQGRRN